MKLANLMVLIVAGALLDAPAMAQQKIDRQAISKALGGMEPASIQPSPIEGLYEVMSGVHVYYTTADGEYLINGDLFESEGKVNLTEERRQSAQRDMLNSLSDDEMVVFSPDKVKHTITVFTDVDCGYCRKLHAEIDNYLKAGIEVRYMFYPRAGVGSESYRKAVAVWCSRDRMQALTDAKAGKAIEMKTCDNPVDKHMKLAEEFGLRGTPMVVYENGRIQPGYMPAQRLILELDKLASK